MSNAKKRRHEKRPKVVAAQAAARAWRMGIAAHLGMRRPKRRSWAKKAMSRAAPIDVHQPIAFRSIVRMWNRDGTS